APWIGDVTGPAWNDMNVGVQHRLPRRRAVIEADVEPVGPELGRQLAADQGHQPPDRCLLFLGKIEQASDVPLGDDERMPFGDGIAVAKRPAAVVLQGNSGRRKLTEGAGLWIHVRTRPRPTRRRLAGRCLPFALSPPTEGLYCQVIE